ncbi:RHS repeat-associated core domain-containing protein [Zooshikella ganghwensis]|uniref:RHS repeat protein n=1 Tax=Zooshikella ganghwensis TaxID=202772 RepID=A0A4P9VT86_9GAMM|nr:RHS repeat-associated core domain-containing protein [Zooshikella ganghwensis]RDH45260.1 hypothetical protein B9G39_18415 [Zooshikella ganghwensis]
MKYLIRSCLFILFSLPLLANAYTGCCSCGNSGKSHDHNYVKCACDREDSPGQPEGMKDECSQGAPVWTVDMVSMNVFMKDIPLWYQAAIGPSVSLQLSYNTQTKHAATQVFGQKWTSNYHSHVHFDGQDKIEVHMPDGAEHTYTKNAEGVFTPPYNVFNQLEKHSDQWVTVTRQSGLAYEYKTINGAGNNHLWLVAIKDKYGLQLTLNYNEKGQLHTLKDAQNQVTTFVYNEAGYITKVADPFGREAKFDYNDQGHLIKLTDMGGYWTTLAYDQQALITKMETPLGHWLFDIEPSDSTTKSSDPYPAPGTKMNTSYRITVTDPNGGKEEYYHGHGRAWYISPNNYVEYQDEARNNFKKAAKTHYDLYKHVSGKGRIQKISYPDGREVAYAYDTDTGLRKSSTTQGQTQTYQKNSQGNITQLTTALGETVSYQYADNGLDVTQITTPQGNIELRYNKHRNPTYIKDIKGRETQLTYNSYGQLTTMQVGEQQQWGYSYNDKQQLTSITFNGEVTKQYTYDNIGRVKTITDETGLTRTFAYNGLDSTTTVTYPDGKQTTTTYGQCPRLVTSETDRGGRTYRYEYDAAKQLTKLVSPEGTATQFEYDANGNLITLIDANRNATRFEFNKADQLTAKVFADGSKIQYTYDQGQVKTRKDARGIATTYHYDDKKRLQKVSYSDNTPEVTYTYNDKGQVTTITDGLGQHQYVYSTLGQLTSVDGPWEKDTIAYHYNQDGKLEKTTIEQGQTLIYQYDAQGRLTNIKQGERTFAYQYQGVSNVVEKLTFPNGLVSSYQFDQVNRAKRIDHKANASKLITYYDFTYNDKDLLAQEEYEPLADITVKQEELVVNQFNELNQLVEEKDDKVKTPQFDQAGNMIKGMTVKGAVFEAKYDAENRLTEITFTDQEGIKHKRQYKYFYNSFLAEIKKYQNDTLTQTTRFVREGNLALQERDIENKVKREYVWGLSKGGGVGGLLSLTQDNQHYYYVYDGKGNIVGVINQANEVVAGYHYEPFGKRVSKSGAFEQPFGFSTKRYDEDTGLLYYGYRYYIPHQSIWLTRDPLGERGGINLYGFVGNDPINYFDPDGQIKKKIAETLFVLMALLSDGDDAGRQSHDHKDNTGRTEQYREVKPKPGEKDKKLKPKRKPKSPLSVDPIFFPLENSCRLGAGPCDVCNLIGTPNPTCFVPDDFMC